MQTYTYTIQTPDKTFHYSTQLPYVEAVLYYIKILGLSPKQCTIYYNDIQINPSSKDYNLNHYKKNYLKIMGKQTTYKSIKLFHVDNLK